MFNKEKSTETLTSKIAVRVKPSERFQLQHDADLANLSVSELIRRQYFNRAIVARTDEIMLAELLRLGRLLKHVHNQTSGAYKQQTAQVLTDISSCIKRIGN